jgi:hypothetical protein
MRSCHSRADSGARTYTSPRDPLPDLLSSEHSQGKGQHEQPRARASFTPSPVAATIAWCRCPARRKTVTLPWVAQIGDECEQRGYPEDPAKKCVNSRRNRTVDRRTDHALDSIGVEFHETPGCVR